MSTQSNELRIAMAWRVREISYYQRVVEASRSANDLTSAERDSLRIFATEEIHRLNLASDDDVIKLYNYHMAIVTAVEKAVAITEQELSD